MPLNNKTGAISDVTFFLLSTRLGSVYGNGETLANQALMVLRYNEYEVIERSVLRNLLDEDENVRKMVILAVLDILKKPIPTMLEAADLS